MDKIAMDHTTKIDQVSVKTETASTNTRRKFLLGATLGTAGAVAVAVAGGSKQALEVAIPGATAEPGTKPKGYHVTAHISQYYDTTRM